MAATVVQTTRGLEQRRRPDDRVHDGRTHQESLAAQAVDDPAVKGAVPPMTRMGAVSTSGVRADTPAVPAEASWMAGSTGASRTAPSTDKQDLVGGDLRVVDLPVSCRPSSRRPGRTRAADRTPAPVLVEVVGAVGAWLAQPADD